MPAREKRDCPAQWATATPGNLFGGGKETRAPASWSLMRHFFVLSVTSRKQCLCGEWGTALFKFRFNCELLAPAYETSEVMFSCYNDLACSVLEGNARFKTTFQVISDWNVLLGPGTLGTVIVDGGSFARVACSGSLPGKRAFEEAVNQLWPLKRGGHAAETEICGSDSCPNTNAALRRQTIDSGSSRIFLLNTLHQTAPCCFVNADQQPPVSVLRRHEEAVFHFTMACSSSVGPSGEKVQAPFFSLLDGVPAQWIQDVDAPLSELVQELGSPSRRLHDWYQTYDRPLPAIQADNFTCHSPQTWMPWGSIANYRDGEHAIVSSVFKAVESVRAQRFSDSSRAALHLYEYSSKQVVGKDQCVTGGPTFIKLGGHLSALVPQTGSPIGDYLPAIRMISSDLMWFVELLLFSARIAYCLPQKGVSDHSHPVLQFLDSLELVLVDTRPEEDQPRRHLLIKLCGDGGASARLRTEPHSVALYWASLALDLVKNLGAAGPCVRAQGEISPARPNPGLNPVFVRFYDNMPFGKQEPKKKKKVDGVDTGVPAPPPAAAPEVVRAIERTDWCLFHELDFKYHFPAGSTNPSPETYNTPEDTRALWMLRYASSGYSNTKYLVSESLCTFSYVVAPADGLYSCLKYGWTPKPVASGSSLIGVKGEQDGAAETESNVPLDAMGLVRARPDCAQELEFYPLPPESVEYEARYTKRIPTSFKCINTRTWCVIMLQ